MKNDNLKKTGIVSGDNNVTKKSKQSIEAELSEIAEDFKQLKTSSEAKERKSEIVEKVDQKKKQSDKDTLNSKTINNNNQDEKAEEETEMFLEFEETLKNIIKEGTTSFGEELKNKIKKMSEEISENINKQSHVFDSKLKKLAEAIDTELIKQRRQEDVDLALGRALVTKKKIDNFHNERLASISSNQKIINNFEKCLNISLWLKSKNNIKQIKEMINEDSKIKEMINDANENYSIKTQLKPETAKILEEITKMKCKIEDLFSKEKYANALKEAATAINEYCFNNKAYDKTLRYQTTVNNFKTRLHDELSMHKIEYFPGVVTHDDIRDIDLILKIASANKVKTQVEKKKIDAMLFDIVNISNLYHNINADHAIMKIKDFIVEYAKELPKITTAVDSFCTAWKDKILFNQLMSYNFKTRLNSSLTSQQDKNKTTIIDIEANGRQIKNIMTEINKYIMAGVDKLNAMNEQPKPEIIKVLKEMNNTNCNIGDLLFDKESTKALKDIISFVKNEFKEEEKVIKQYKKKAQQDIKNISDKMVSLYREIENSDEKNKDQRIEDAIKIFERQLMELEDEYQKKTENKTITNKDILNIKEPTKELTDKGKINKEATDVNKQVEKAVAKNNNKPEMRSMYKNSDKIIKVSTEINTEESKKNNLKSNNQSPQDNVNESKINDNSKEDKHNSEENYDSSIELENSSINEQPKNGDLQTADKFKNSKNNSNMEK